MDLIFQKMTSRVQNVKKNDVEMTPFKNKSTPISVAYLCGLRENAYLKA